MNIQLALDRLTIAEAIDLGNQVRDYVDWIEIGTSLIKEFGMQSVRELRQAFPEKTLVADIKTFDNAQYEFRMCFEAGADVATVMGTAPFVSVQACMKEAKTCQRQVMIDLLNTNETQVQQLLAFDEGIFCLHFSKDQQELSDQRQIGHGMSETHERLLRSNVKLAVAGGITTKTLPGFGTLRPYVVIVGSAITKAKDPVMAAKEIQREAVRFKGAV